MPKHKIETKRKRKPKKDSSAGHQIKVEPKHPRKQRLQKILAAAGIGSRRACEELILESAVTVNGKVIDHIPAFADPEVDTITVNGKRIRAEHKVYFLLNKPKGVICTSADPYGRKKAVDLVDCHERVFCVGRLDADTTGAIILTNDSDLANRLTHPRYELPKTYEVRLKGRIEADAIEKLKKGVWLAEGKTGKAVIKVIKRTATESFVQITISQGLNRQIRRTFARVGYNVKSLRRTRIGNIGLKNLAPGAHIKLTPGQINYLKTATKLP